MVTTTHSGAFVMGLSSDVKPTGPNYIGYRFYETDTGKIYIHTGADWAVHVGGGGGAGGEGVASSILKYIIFATGTSYDAVNTITGTTDFTHPTNASIVINSVIDAINDAGEGGNVFINRGTYPCLTTITNQAHSPDVVRSISFIGDGFQSVIDFVPTTTLQDGWVNTISSAHYSNLRFRGNSNVTRIFRFTGTATLGGDRGSMDFVEIDGPNAHTTGAPVLGQIGIYQDGSADGAYYWSFNAINMRGLYYGFRADGTNAHSTNWTNSTFWNCRTGMHIAGDKHQGTNLTFQGDTTNGEIGIQFTGNANKNTFVNVFGDLKAAGQNCATVQLDASASDNQVLGIDNASDNGTTFRSILDNSGNMTNAWMTRGATQIPIPIHTHDYSLTTHNHAGVYADANHPHSYAPQVHSHPYASDTHNHTGVYAPDSHSHPAHGNEAHTPDFADTGHSHATATHSNTAHSPAFSDTNHNHSGVYAPASHTHSYSSKPHQVDSSAEHSGTTIFNPVSVSVSVPSGGTDSDGQCRSALSNLIQNIRNSPFFS